MCCAREADERVKREIEARLVTGDLGCLEKPKPAVTFAAYAEKWLKNEAPGRCKSSTVDFYRDCQNRYVTPRFGTRNLTQISREEVKDFVADLRARGLPKNTIRLAVASLRVVLSAAVENGIITSNPAVKLGKFGESEKPGGRAVAMEPEAVERFLAATREYCPQHHPLFIIALRAGLRQGEILGLK